MYSILDAPDAPLYLCPSTCVVHNILQTCAEHPVKQIHVLHRLAGASVMRPSCQASVMPPATAAAMAALTPLPTTSTHAPSRSASSSCTFICKCISEIHLRPAGIMLVAVIKACRLSQAACRAKFQHAIGVLLSSCDTDLLVDPAGWLGQVQ